MEYQTYAPRQQKFKKRVFVATVSIFAAVLAWAIYSYGFIEVAQSREVTGDSAYQIVSQKNNQPVFSGVSSNTVKKLVRRGNYEVNVNHASGSYLAIIRTGGFGSTKKLNAILQPENERAFIGTNPKPCMTYSGKVLVSSSCLGALENTAQHVPATTASPSYVKKIRTGLSGIVEGFYSTGGVNYVLVKSISTSRDQAVPHTLYPISDESGDLLIGLDLPELAKDRTYSIRNYAGGFLIHDSLYRQVLFYDKPGAAPTEIKLAGPSNNDYLPYALSAAKDSILVAYTNAVSDGALDIHDTESGKAMTEVVVNHSGQVRRYRFKGIFGSVQLCGNQNVCMINEHNVLHVYDIAGKKSKLLFVLGEVEDIKDLAGNPVIVRKGSVVFLDSDKGEGFTQYSLGDYRYCGLELLGSNYILCVASNSASYALYIDTKVSDNTSIDKKVLDLQQLSVVKSLSVYGQFVHIVPELGQKQYMPEIAGYGYTERAKREANDIIDQEIKKLGLDQNKYLIIKSSR